MVSCPTLRDLVPPPKGEEGWPWTEESPRLPQVMPGGQPWPRITVVTPSYNQGQFIEETIRSVLLQGYPNLQYLIMDGGSTDASVAIIRKYAPYISAWVSKPDGGQADAIAAGFEQATGEILAWLCSDDLYLPGALTWIAKRFTAHPNTDLICGETRLDQGRGWEDWMGMRYRNSVPTRRKLVAFGQCVRQPGCFWRADAYRRTRGVDRSLQFCMDYDILLELCRVGKARYFDYEIAWMRSHAASKSDTLYHVHNRERASIVNAALTETPYSGWHLCTIAYLDRIRSQLRNPRAGFLQKAIDLGRTGVSYLYHLMRGGLRRWHPINGFPLRG